MKINDEIYPGEAFNIKIYNNEKPKTFEENGNIKIYNFNIDNFSQSIFNNNINKIGIKCRNTISEEKKRLEEKIKMLEFELIKKNKFNTLKISSSVSTIEINSSYENINKISDNKYILDGELRELTKNFIQNKIKIWNKPLNSSFNSEKEISSDIKNDNSNYLSLQKTDEIKNQKSIKIRHLLSSSEKNNNKNLNFNAKRNVQHLLKSIIKCPQNQENQAENFLNKVKSINRSSINLKPVNGRDSANQDETTYKSIIKNEGKKLRNSKILTKNFNNVNNFKKKKKKKELDIISVNIQKSSQNLNQPDVFYAGLFSKLIFKSPTFKHDNKFKNKDNDKDIIK